jgi:hypothetical protein
LDGFDPNPRAMLVDLYFRIGVPTAALNELDAYLRFLSTSEQPSKAASFLEGLLVERPENVEIQKRLVTYYRDKDQLPLAIEKLDALAEKTLGAEDIPGTMATLEHIISLQPPNTGDYQKLFMELKAKSGG